jgi:hypothetical protein
VTTKTVVTAEQRSVGHVVALGAGKEQKAKPTPSQRTKGRDMHKKLIMLGVAGLLAIPAAPAFAGSGGGTAHYGAFASTSPDSGTCGNDWATDTFDRDFTVNKQQPNVVVEQFKNGSFVTNAGPSAGGCETNPGGTVSAGITGSMHGEFTIVVSNGTYNPNAVCTAANCSTTAGFVATVYGAGATYDVPTYEFHYSAGKHGEWKNASADRGGDHGDITG